MKSMFSAFILVAFIGGILLTAGCGGGGGGGSPAAPVIPGVLLATISAAGPTGVAFATSKRGGARSAVYADSLSINYVLKITPNGQNTVSTSTATVSTDGNTLIFPAVAVTANSTNGQYKVEIFPANAQANAQPIFKYYFVQYVANGNTSALNKGILASDTATALSFEYWAGFGSRIINDFSPNVGSIAALVANINAQLQGIGAFIPSSQTNFQWNPTVIAAAQKIGQNTVNPATTFSVSGYVTAVDTSGETGTLLTLTSTADPSKSYTSTSNSGYYTITGVPNGNYTLTASKPQHTFTPPSYAVSVNGGNVMGHDFQSHQ
ncbi:MAG: carboxypeptidase regulatory-like domain-containing protein [Candidatus Riflebacteria bacterium]|nr:carboxypeptidase regulatory-like domain-containing protein [Candidatus Riflebacteria bacterium]